MTVEKLTKQITSISCGSEQLFLLLSDVHFDSCSCERELLRETLNEAVANDAIVIFNGDFFDMMQGRNDRRGGKGHLRKEYLGDNYFDLVIMDAMEFLKPYAHHIAIMADGNHETAVTKNCETNPLDRLCWMLRKETGCNTIHAGYQGWVVLNLDYSSGNASFSIKMHHGAGGNARVTKGVIEHNRMSTYVQGADMIWLGHTHTQYCMHSTTEVLNLSKKEVELKKAYHLRTGCWKQEYKDGGWAVEKGFSPSEIGGYWMHLKHHRKNGTREIKVRIYPT